MRPLYEVTNEPLRILNSFRAADFRILLLRSDPPGKRETQQVAGTDIGRPVYTKELQSTRKRPR